MEKTPNTTTMLVKYFSTPDRPVKLDEFRAFWTSLTDEDKQYFKTVNLETGLVDAA